MEQSQSQKLKSTALKSPFEPVSSRHPKLYIQWMGMIRDKTEITWKEKTVLKALLSNTTNEKLFYGLSKLPVEHLRQLSKLALTAINNLKNTRGRPSTNPNTPEKSQNKSPAPKVAEDTVMGDAPQTGSSGQQKSGPTSLSAGIVRSEGATVSYSDIFTVLQIDNDLPNPPLKKPVRSDKMGKLSTERDYLCLFTLMTLGSSEMKHIFPFSSLSIGDKTKALTWQFFTLFLSAENRADIVKNVYTAADKLNTPKNGLTLDLMSHLRFGKGWIAYLPIRKHSIGDRGDFMLDVQYTCYCSPYSLVCTTTLAPQEPEEQVIFEEGTRVIILGMRGRS
ncbi:hypothetical protein TWF694_004612 [Orbilia ellipsospora]|uniref:HNH nuclease domain-containing protein n=1 Tax=Orbilia ellipsospora TaxID=2528407 RepID=A0AAV9WVR8_9PEZI